MEWLSTMEWSYWLIIVSAVLLAGGSLNGILSKNEKIEDKPAVEDPNPIDNPEMPT